ncbi:MAG: 16S rRNA (guanine(527)-N(7))-methyltransferase RsmG [Synechococcales bacterium]|nr:16S rRNA (guanine(527)-N(7))-methyltransferase RsmG [Synechococcales bacterium]
MTSEKPDQLRRSPPSPPFPPLPDATDHWQTTLHWQPSPFQQEQFQQLYHGILAGNQTLNLTRITAPDEFWEKHLWDSLSGIRAFLSEAASPETSVPEAAGPPPVPLRLIDIGTGAGFPGLPVAIAHPSWTVTLLDATRKKVAFLETLVATLGLENVTCLAERVEALGQQPRHRETYELALVRAVAPAPVGVEYALPLLKVGGTAVLYRGQWSDSETDELRPVVERLGGVIQAIKRLQTPLTGGDRHLIHLQKVTSTPREFPRGVGIPTKQPLQP